jgi:hypothetical protein
MGESSYDIGRGAPPITWAQALGCCEPLRLRHKTILILQKHDFIQATLLKRFTKVALKLKLPLKCHERQIYSTKCIG